MSAIARLRDERAHDRFERKKLVALVADLREQQAELRAAREKSETYRRANMCQEGPRGFVMVLR